MHDSSHRLPSVMARAAVCATAIYAAALLLLLAATEIVGERFWFFAVLLYFPVQIWLLPLLALAPACLFLRLRRMYVVHALCVLVVLLYSKWHWASGPPAAERVLTCVTNNIGESNHQSMQPFLEVEKPDIIALQETSGRAGAYQREYPDWFVAARDQFILISKLPIKRAAVLAAPKWHNRPIAAQFEVDAGGSTPLVIYNVHFPSPRPAFQKLRGKGLLRELLGRNRSNRDNQSFAETITARVELARELAQVFEQEKRPFLALGDFNTPNHGYIHRLFASRMTDAFANSGRGFGWTFPGYVNHRLAFLGPWLRLDYLFAGNGWRPLYARVEPGRKSQHRAVVARFQPL